MPGVHEYKKAYFVNAKMFTNETYPKLNTVDIIFDRVLKLSLKSHGHIFLSELSGPGVSSNQTVIYFPEVNALAVGDLIHHKARAWLEGGIVQVSPVPTIASWINDLREIKANYDEKNPIVYGGRGEAVTVDHAVDQQIGYLEKVDRIVGKYVKDLGSSRGELKGPLAGQHYANIQKLCEVAFPDYSLAYMIQYGVYGLALSK